MKYSKLSATLIACGLLAGASAFAQSTPAKPGTGQPTTPPATTPGMNATGGMMNPGPAGAGTNAGMTAMPAEMQDLMKQMGAQHDALMTTAHQLMGQLATASAADRQKILDEFAKNQAAMMDQQRDLAKQIRDEMHKLRDQHKPGGG